MKNTYYKIGIFVLFSAAFSFCIWRDFQNEKHYTGDLRNRVVGARLQKDGISPYFYVWQSSDGLRYYNPAFLEAEGANAITASPFFHHLLYPIADLPQRQISYIWFALEYALILFIILIAFSFTKNQKQQWVVTCCSVLFLFTTAWITHMQLGQMYIVVPLLSFTFLFFFIKRNNFIFLFISGLTAVLLVLIRPTAVLFFIPFLLLIYRFSRKQLIVFFLPVVILLVYSFGQSRERSYWMDYRRAVIAHIHFHSSDHNKTDLKNLYSHWEGWDTASINASKIAHPFEWRSESSSIGIFFKDAFQMHIPVSGINLILATTLVLLLFLWFRQGKDKKYDIIVISIFGFCLYMISDFLSPLFRIQYYGVQWIFPLLLMASFYDKRNRLIYFLLLTGLLLNITNTPYLKMRHTIGEVIILFTLLWFCLNPKSPQIS